MNHIHRLLIANRGEIACRIIRTAKKLGLYTIAIYSEADKDSLHCQLADEAHCVGPLPLEKSYLNIAEIIKVAQASQAHAIHPGYGFLSENARFSKACLDANIIFVGPSHEAIGLMASKDDAKMSMHQAGVPVIPGYNGTQQDEATLSAEADRIGYPVLLKAAKGGGGKGMRYVLEPKDLKEAIAAAKRESLSSFGDDTLIIEKYLDNARHIEVQIICDNHGNALHLFERDCSLQRRHQKVIECAPALGLTAKTKQTLYDSALLAAKTIHYTNAGTIEFLVDQQQNVYFMEMNTRLQVEHPVTEAITGVDLVAWQLLVADGQPLPVKQEALKADGFAIEARVYAEDPYNHFYPSTGFIHRLILPEPTLARVDIGVQAGEEVSIYFDPMIAKVITHAATHELAAHQLVSALKAFHLIGVTTNLPFLKNILLDPFFLAGNTHTRYVTDHLGRLLPKREEPNAFTLAQACLIKLLSRPTPQTDLEPNSPWKTNNTWRLNLAHDESLQLKYQDKLISIHTEHHPQGYHLRCPEYHLDAIVSGHIFQEILTIHYDALTQSSHFYIDNTTLYLFDDAQWQFDMRDLNWEDDDHSHDHNHALAPMPGIITKVWVKSGDQIEKGAKLLALEAMKMEHTVLAPKSGTIKQVHYRLGDQVKEGVELVNIE